MRPREHQDRAASGRERPGAVGLGVVADHDDVGGRKADFLQGEVEEGSRRLADEQRRAADEINRWVAAGELKANIDCVMPLAEAAAATARDEAAAR